MNKFSEGLWRPVFHLVYGGWYDVQVEGREHIPDQGAAIIAPNHVSNNDPPLIGYALPRHVNFMAKEELFRNPLFSLLIRWLGAFPVRRDGVDKIAIRRAMEILKAGLLLGIFPEGSRQEPGHLGEFHDGAASLALRMGVPIIPTAVIGSKSLSRGSATIAFGEPLIISRSKATPAAVNEVNRRLKEAISTLIFRYSGSRQR